VSDSSELLRKLSVLKLQGIFHWIKHKRNFTFNSHIIIKNTTLVFNFTFFVLFRRNHFRELLSGRLQATMKKNSNEASNKKDLRMASNSCTRQSLFVHASHLFVFFEPQKHCVRPVPISVRGAILFVTLSRTRPEIGTKRSHHDCITSSLGSVKLRTAAFSGCSDTE